MQSELNKVWRAEADPLPGEPAPPAIEDSLPPRTATEPEPAAPSTPDTGPERPERQQPEPPG